MAKRPLREAFDAYAFSFEGHRFIAYIIDDPLSGQPIYLPVNDICEAIGVDANTQRKRINNHPVLAASAIDLDVSRVLESDVNDAFDEKAIAPGSGGVRRPLMALHVKRLAFDQCHKNSRPRAASQSVVVSVGLCRNCPRSVAAQDFF
jgi:hypothetical protein